MPVMTLNSLEKVKLQPSLLHFVLKLSSGCSGQFCSSRSSAGALWLQGSLCAEVRVRSQGGLPGLSTRHGNGSSKAERLEWERRLEDGCMGADSSPYLSLQTPLWTSPRYLVHGME